MGKGKAGGNCCGSSSGFGYGYVGRPQNHNATGVVVGIPITYGKEQDGCSP